MRRLNPRREYGPALKMDRPLRVETYIPIEGRLNNCQPRCFSGSGHYLLVKAAAKELLQLILNSQSRPYSRWFPAGPAP